MKKKLTFHIHIGEWFLRPDVIVKNEEKLKFKKASFLCFTIINLTIDKDHEAFVQKN